MTTQQLQSPLAGAGNQSNATSEQAKVTLKFQGERSQTLVLDAAAFVKYSQFFAAALGGNWKESARNTICFDVSDVRPPDFTIFYKFLKHADGIANGIYDFEEAIKKIIESSNPLKENKADMEEYKLLAGNKKGFAMGGRSGIFYGEIDFAIERLISCYHLGEYFGSPPFCNTIVDVLSNQVRKFYANSSDTHPSPCIPLWNLHVIFGGIPGSGLQRFFADAIYSELSLEKLNALFHDEMLGSNAAMQIAFAGIRHREGMKKYATNAEPKLPWAVPAACRYHDHPEKGHLTLFDFECSDVWGRSTEDPSRWDTYTPDQNDDDEW